MNENNEIYTLEPVDFIIWLRGRKTVASKKCLQKVENHEYEFCIVDRHITAVARFSPHIIPNYVEAEITKYNKQLI